MSFKIYTKTGDAGTTGLYGGSRVAKDDIRIDAYGTVDELNSHIGLLRAHMEAAAYQQKAQAVDGLLEVVQSQLFTMGSQLATPPEKKLSIEPLTDANVSVLEQGIDSLDADLSALSSFILPGGDAATSQCHVCRTVTRRAERCVVALAHTAEVDAVLIRYLNRLSDYFFTLSRTLTQLSGRQDQAWNP